MPTIFTAPTDRSVSSTDFALGRSDQTHSGSFLVTAVMEIFVHPSISAASVKKSELFTSKKTLNIFHLIIRLKDY
jgi:hypothetical protein